MQSLTIAHVTLATYAALLAVGGIIGFVKARSTPSLVAGLVSAIAALVALSLSLAKFWVGTAIGSLLAIVLFVFFGYRYARSRKIMPAGVMAIVSLIVLAIMMAVTDWR